MKTHLYLDDASLLHHKASHLLEQFEGALRQLHLHGDRSALHAGRRVYGVAKQAVAGHLDADHSRHDRPAMDPRSQLYMHKEIGTEVGRHADRQAGKHALPNR